MNALDILIGAIALCLGGLLWYKLRYEWWKKM